MKKPNLLLVISILTVILYACSNDSSPVNQELAEISFDKLSYDTPHFKEANLTLKKGQKLEFWSDIDIQFEGDIEMTYLIELWEKDKKIGGFELNALKTNPTLLNSRVQIGNKTRWQFQGKMDFLIIDNNCNYTFKTLLYCSNSNINCRKAKLIFR